MDEKQFAKALRRFPPRKRTCLAATVIWCIGLVLAALTWLTDSWTSRVSDATAVWFVISFLVSMVGLVYGLVLGRAPRRFVILFLVTLPIFAILIRFPRPLVGPDPFAPPPIFTTGTP